MFILNGNRRINLHHIKEYRPSEKNISSGSIYILEIFYIGGEKEEIFFSDKEKRDNYLKEMDSSFKLIEIK